MKRESMIDIKNAIYQFRCITISICTYILDSDYQLGSAVQTPGLNKSVSPGNNVIEYETESSPIPSPGIMPSQPLPQNNTNATTGALHLQDAYSMNRDRSYPPQNVSNWFRLNHFDTFLS